MSAPAKKAGPKGAGGKKGDAEAKKGAPDAKKGTADGKKGGADGKKRKNAAAHVTENNLKKRGLFSKDLRLMMYGYGDAPAPYKETVDLVEDIVVEYASTLAHTALAGAAGKGGRMLPEDLLFLLRKETLNKLQPCISQLWLLAGVQDPHKFARAQELLRMNEEIKKAKKTFEADDTLVYEEG